MSLVPKKAGVVVHTQFVGVRTLDASDLQRMSRRPTVPRKVRGKVEWDRRAGGQHEAPEAAARKPRSKASKKADEPSEARAAREAALAAGASQAAADAAAQAVAAVVLAEMTKEASTGKEEEDQEPEYVPDGAPALLQFDQANSSASFRLHEKLRTMASMLGGVNWKHLWSDSLCVMAASGDKLEVPKKRQGRAQHRSPARQGNARRQDTVAAEMLDMGSSSETEDVSPSRSTFSNASSPTRQQHDSPAQRGLKANRWPVANRQQPRRKARVRHSPEPHTLPRGKHPAEQFEHLRGQYQLSPTDAHPYAAHRGAPAQHRKHGEPAAYQHPTASGAHTSPPTHPTGASPSVYDIYGASPSGNRGAKGKRMARAKPPRAPPERGSPQGTDAHVPLYGARHGRAHRGAAVPPDRHNAHPIPNEHPERTDSTVPAEAKLLAALHEVPRDRREKLLSMLEGMEKQLLGNSLELPPSEIGYLVHAAAANTDAQEERRANEGIGGVPSAGDHQPQLSRARGHARLPDGGRGAAPPSSNVNVPSGLRLNVAGKPAVPKRKRHGAAGNQKQTAARRLIEKFVDALLDPANIKIRSAAEASTASKKKLMLTPERLSQRVLADLGIKLTRNEMNVLINVLDPNSVQTTTLDYWMLLAKHCVPAMKARLQRLDASDSPDRPTPRGPVRASGRNDAGHAAEPSERPRLKEAAKRPAMRGDASPADSPTELWAPAKPHRAIDPGYLRARAGGGRKGASGASASDLGSGAGEQTVVKHQASHQTSAAGTNAGAKRAGAGHGSGGMGRQAEVVQRVTAVASSMVPHAAPQLLQESYAGAQHPEPMGLYEFQGLLADTLDLVLSLSEAHALARCFSARGDRLVDWSEFVSWFWSKSREEKVKMTKQSAQDSFLRVHSEPQEMTPRESPSSGAASPAATSSAQVSARSFGMSGDEGPSNVTSNSARSPPRATKSPQETSTLRQREPVGQDDEPEWRFEESDDEDAVVSQDAALAGPRREEEQEEVRTSMSPESSPIAAATAAAEVEAHVDASSEGPADGVPDLDRQPRSPESAQSGAEVTSARSDRSMHRPDVPQSPVLSRANSAQSGAYEESSDDSASAIARAPQSPPASPESQNSRGVEGGGIQRKPSSPPPASPPSPAGNDSKPGPHAFGAVKTAKPASPPPEPPQSPPDFDLDEDSYMDEDYEDDDEFEDDED